MPIDELIEDVDGITDRGDRSYYLDETMKNLKSKSSSKGLFLPQLGDGEPTYYDKYESGGGWGVSDPIMDKLVEEKMLHQGML